MLVTPLGIIVVLHPAIKVFDAVSMIALQLLRESYVPFPFSTDIEAMFSHQAKAYSPMLVTLLGIMTEVNPVLAKAY